MGPGSSESGGHSAVPLSASLFLSAPGACPLLLTFRAMHWQFPLPGCLFVTLSNSSTKDQLKIIVTSAAYYNSKYSQRVVLGPTLASSPGKLLEMHILGPSSNLSTWKLGVGSRNSCFSKTSRGFWCLLKLETTVLSTLPTSAHWIFTTLWGKS